MVSNPDDPDSISAGSFFTNPIVSETFARTLPADAPRFPTEPEDPPRVLPLGSEVTVRRRPTRPASSWSSSAPPGSSSGPGSSADSRCRARRAAISSKHTLAIVNRGGATASEVVQLAGYVQTRVESEFGVRLQNEPMLIGVQL